MESMDTPKSELTGPAHDNDESDQNTPSDMTKKLETINEDYMMTKVLYDTTQQNYGKSIGI